MTIAAADDLYGLALERFVAERAALAKSLRSTGHRDEATRVAALRKPSVAAWAVNQLARTQGEAMAALFSTGDDLARAQAELLAGRGDPATLRAATERERDAVQRLTASARGLLSDDGHDLSPATLERVAGTLHAAALDGRVRDQVTAGRLERELRHVGLGSDAPAAISDVGAPRTAARGSGASSTRGRRGRDSDADPGTDRDRDRDRDRDAERTRREAAEQERAERERARRLAAARQVEGQARRRSETAEQAVTIAREHRDHAAQVLRDADAALSDAEQRARAAADAHRYAQDELGRT